ncbi:MAG: single-stranded DNA-binding protein [Clostridia bacterium]|nr:single-stranded DNA-binding protein [Clostridia bacterium]
MNALHIMGRLCSDPEITSTQSGTTIARYTVAVDRRFAKDGQQKTDFFSCSSFGKQAEFVEKFLKKGVKVVVSGEMRLDTVQKDGKNVTYPKVAVNEIEFAESKKESGEAKDDFLNIADNVDDLPFN